LLTDAKCFDEEVARKESTEGVLRLQSMKTND